MRYTIVHLFTGWWEDMVSTACREISLTCVRFEASSGCEEEIWAKKDKMLLCLRRGDTAAARILSQDLETLKTKAERRLAKLHQRNCTEAAQKQAVTRVGVGGEETGRGDAGAGGDAAAPSMAARRLEEEIARERAETEAGREVSRPHTLVA